MAIRLGAEKEKILQSNRDELGRAGAVLVARNDAAAPSTQSTIKKTCRRYVRHRTDSAATRVILSADGLVAIKPRRLGPHETVLTRSSSGRGGFFDGVGRATAACCLVGRAHASRPRTLPVALGCISLWAVGSQEPE